MFDENLDRSSMCLLALMVIGSICGFVFILIQLILLIDFAHRSDEQQRYCSNTHPGRSLSFFPLVGMKTGWAEVKMVVKFIISV
jgi:hypothetical protein